MTFEIFLFTFLRLMSYPIAAFGLGLLAISRPGWRQRPTTFALFACAAVMLALFAALWQRLAGGPIAVLMAADILVTPVLLIATAVIWYANVIRVKKLTTDKALG